MAKKEKNEEIEEKSSASASPQKSKYFPSPTKKSPRRAKKPTYVNLDDDDDDLEDEFQPDANEEEDPEDDFNEELNVDEESDRGQLEPEPLEPEIDDEPEPIREILPEPEKKTPKRKAPKFTPTEDAAQVTEILALIPDAELPDAPETEGKLNYFALKNKQLQLPEPTGAIELPEAAPNCLGGLTIVFTGVLPNLDREAAEQAAKRYGGRVTKSISGKTSLVVIGDEAGPLKVKKIKQLGIKAINEGGFIELLSKMPADGGGSASAQAAKFQREEEQRAIEEAAREEEERERKREEARIRKEKARQEEEEKLRRQEEKDAKAKKPGNVKAEPKAASRLPPEQPREIPNSEKLWTTKYAPTDLNQLCGNKGNVQKLKTWLTNWFEYARHDFKNPGADGGGVFRAALISGPPGIGKTTAAHLVAKQLGYDVLEKNASDVRSKSLLNTNIKSVLNNTSVVGFFKHRNDDVAGENDRKFCLIMDEVDGMSSGDHGGAGALSAFCRITKMPLILICNDKSLPKMRTFDRVTYDLPFRRPSETEMRARLLTIALREHLKLDPSVIAQLVQATGNDIRQIINLMLTVLKTQKVIGPENLRQIAESWKKHTALKPFAITQQMLSPGMFSPNSTSTLNDKIDLYFNDIDFTPLMIQENYLSTRPNVKTPEQHLEKVAAAADAISLSDQVNSLIRSSEQQWSLLPFHGVMSTVKPCLEVNGAITARINFTSWLGQNSKTMKYQRMLQELQYHTRLRTTASKTDLRTEYMPLLSVRVSTPLVTEGEAGIQDVMDVMDHYYMTREDWDNVMDFCVGPNSGADVLKKIPTKVKSAFTRKYNSVSHPMAIYRTGNSLAGGTRKQKVDSEDVVEDDTARDEELETEEKTDGIDAKRDKLIKEVKSKKGKAKTTKAKKETKKK